MIDQFQLLVFEDGPGLFVEVFVEGALRRHGHVALFFVVIIFTHAKTAKIVIATGSEELVYVDVVTVFIEIRVYIEVFCIVTFFVFVGFLFADFVVSFIAAAIVDAIIHAFEVFQCGIVEQLLTHLFLKILGIELQQLDELNLLGTQLLQKLLR